LAINFPNAPTVGQTYLQYQWDGEAWTGNPTTGGGALTLTGDVSGTGSGTVPSTVTGLQGRPVAVTAPNPNQILTWGGTSWAPGSLAVGDITAVVAGAGLTGGGTSGDVTLALTTPAVPLAGGTMTGGLIAPVLTTQVSSGNAAVQYRNTAAAITSGGLWRMAVGGGGNFNIQSNTAAAGDFSTVAQAVAIAPAGAMSLSPASGGDPLSMTTIAGTNCRTLYTVSGQRQWSAGELNNGTFAIADESAAATRLSIDTSGNTTVTGALRVGPGTNNTLAVDVSWTQLYAPDSTTQYMNAIDIGTQAAGGIIYYRNTEHIFQSANSTASFADFKASGTYNSTGSWLTFSSQEIKSEVADYTQGIEAIAALRPVTYRYAGPADTLAADDGNTHVGLLAEEVAPVMPECVGEGDLGELGTVATLDNGPILFALINSVQALLARIEALEAARA
jgi:hypothetical protein